MRKNKRHVLKGAVCFSVILCLFFLSYSVRRLYGELIESPHLEIKNIDIVGRKMVTEEEILELSDIYKGKNILTVKTGRVERALKTHPYIEEVKVKKVLPSRVNIELAEREPFLIVNLDGLYLMDKKGILFKKYSAEDAIDLPVLTGFENIEDGVAKTELFSLVSAMEESIGEANIKNISEIHMDPVYGFTILTLDGGVRIDIGNGDFKRKLLSFEKVIASRGATARGIVSVDLNTSRGVIVKEAETLRNEKRGRS